MIALSHQEDSFEFSPPVVLQSLPVANGQISVAREDLLTGGTKQRAIAPYLEQLQRKGFSEFVYASPFCGFAQVALAYCAFKLRLRATIFCELDPNTQNFHEFAKLAMRFGAKLIACHSLGEAEKKAQEYADPSFTRFKIPLGFADPRYTSLMAVEVKKQIQHLSHHLGRVPQRIWLPVGSGTLASIFSELVPRECELICVDVRVLAPNDHRIEYLKTLPNILLRRANEVFHERAEKPPQVPSNVHYDAKLWRHIHAEAQNGDLWWNVAR